MLDADELLIGAVGDLEDHLRAAQDGDRRRSLHEQREQPRPLQLGLAPRGLPRSADIDRRVDPGDELPRREGFDEVVVGAGSQALEAGLFAGARREHDHRNRLGRGRLPDLLEQAKAVEPRHHHVGEDQAGPELTDLGEGREPVGRDLDAPVLAQEPGDVVAHVLVVVGEEHQRALGRARVDEPRGLHRRREVVAVTGLLVVKPTLRLLDIGAGERGRAGEDPPLSDVSRREMREACGQKNGEGRPHVEGAGGGDRPAVEVHELLHQREPDPRALVGSPLGALHAMKALEEPGHLFFGHADPGVGHLEGDAVAHPLQAERDPAREREFEGVGEQVEHDLLPHVPIDEDLLGQGVEIDLEREAGAVDRRAEHAGEIGGEPRQVHRLEEGLGAAGLDAREIEEVVDELEQPLGVAVDELELEPPPRSHGLLPVGEDVLDRAEHQRQRGCGTRG